MKTHELLAPAGNMECLKQAVYNGADAVYLGCKNFGARKFASNFTNDEIIEALKLCHFFGVKVYATMNTLVKDSEVSSFLEQIEFLYKSGIDAVLIQDFGMLCLIREKYPDLEVHASTQANTSSKATAKLFYDLGVKRVVFSREMSLEEINAIDVPIEKEIFVHGALCICYSGCCLMSSQMGGRSGNRGECAGSCRLPYSLKHNGKIILSDKYLLSTKELNSSKNFEKLLESNIDCFKIEGRMKSPEYVGFITRYYRNLIDNYNKVDIQVENNKLKTLFNRGFTSGHLFNCDTNSLMNQNTPNHIGLEIGKVIEITKDKIKIKLTKPLNQQDGIRFLESNKGLIVNYLYDKKMKLVNYATDICYIDNKIGLTECDSVCKTIDYKLNLELKKLPIRKVPIKVSVKALLNEKLQIEVSDYKNEIKVEGNVVAAAKNQPISKERIATQVLKLGNTNFICSEIFVECSDNIFLSIQEINEVRREALEKLKNIRELSTKKLNVKEPIFKALGIKQTSEISITVFNEEQLLAGKSLKVNCIYTPNHTLYLKYKNDGNVYYKLPRCSRIIDKQVENNSLTSDYFTFNNTKQNIIGDYGLNVYNIYTAYYLHQLGLNKITLSVELTEQEMINFLADFYQKFNFYPNVEVLNYGLVENMIIKGNILNLETNDYNYELLDLKNRSFKTYYDNKNTHVLNYKTKEEITDKKLLNQVSLRFDFYNESPSVIKDILTKYLS